MNVFNVSHNWCDTQLDQYVLDFGSRGQLASLHEKKQQIVHIRNVGCHKAQFHIKPLFGTTEQDRLNWALKVEPKEAILKKVLLADNGHMLSVALLARDSLYQ